MSQLDKNGSVDEVRHPPMENGSAQSNRATGDMSAYVHKFRASGDAFQQSGSTKVNKRNRQPLSCLPCRQRKLKCDRQHPCETCIKRTDEGSCNYSKNLSSSAAKENPSSKTKAQDRLRHLEQLVMQMFENRSPPKMSTVSSTSSASAGPTSSAESNGTPKDGSLDHGPSSAKYVGSTHWSAIMENIQELKSAMVDEAARRGEAGDADEDETADHEILFGAKTAMSLSQILAQYLPPKIAVDRLLATYFNARYMVVPYIHTYQFQRQYEQFWRDQLSMPPLWVSILFSICCLATQLNQVLGGDGPGQGTSTYPNASFLVASAQCLILGGYAYPKPHVVEALGLYSQCKYALTLDPSREVGIIFAILVRLAFRMAYHRDADNFTHFSVFEGEMRRRVWTMCLQFDKMVSFQLGLPNNIPPDSWDTKMPRNLLDSDFSEDISVLPPSRPEHEPTQMLYFIVKARLMASFGQVCNHALSFRSSSEAEIMRLDADIRETFSQVPYTLRIRPMAQSLADPPYLLMVRLNCEFLYQKSLLVLHRKYMTQGFERSTKTCLAAAMSIIECFADIHKEFRPGGALYNNRWMLTSFTMNDFLLAAMVVCLSLSQWRKKNPGRSIDEDTFVTQQLEMLRACHEICRERAPTSVESRKVADALRAMLAQIDPQGPTSVRSNTVGGTNPSDAISPYGQNQTTGGVNQDTVNLTPLRLAEIPMPQARSDPLFCAPLGPFYSFIEGTEDIDWTYLDQYLVNPNRYDEDTMQGIEGQPMGFDGSQDWNSEPYRFLGQGPRPQANHQPGFRPPTDGVGTNGQSQHDFGNNPPLY